MSDEGVRGWGGGCCINIWSTILRYIYIHTSVVNILLRMTINFTGPIISQDERCLSENEIKMLSIGQP